MQADVTGYGHRGTTDMKQYRHFTGLKKIPSIFSKDGDGKPPTTAPLIR